MRSLAHHVKNFRNQKPASSGSSRPPAQRARLQLEALETRLVLYSVSGNAWPHPELPDTT